MNYESLPINIEEIVLRHLDYKDISNMQMCICIDDESNKLMNEYKRISLVNQNISDIDTVIYERYEHNGFQSNTFNIYPYDVIVRLLRSITKSIHKIENATVFYEIKVKLNDLVLRFLEKSLSCPRMHYSRVMTEFHIGKTLHITLKPFISVLASTQYEQWEQAMLADTLI